MEDKLRQKDQELAELKAIELQTRELATFFEDLHSDFARINKSMCASATALENWKEVSRLMAMPDKSQTLVQYPAGTVNKSC